jgi:hypothetical protein
MNFTPGEMLFYERVYEIYTSPEFWALCDSLSEKTSNYYDSNDAIFRIDHHHSNINDEYQTEIHNARFAVLRENGVSYETQNGTWSTNRNGVITTGMGVSIFSAEYKGGMANGAYREIHAYSPEHSILYEEIGTAVSGKKHGISTCQSSNGITQSLVFDNGNNLTQPEESINEVLPQTWGEFGQ